MKSFFFIRVLMLQDSMNILLKCASEYCPTILKQTIIRENETESTTIEQDLRKLCAEKIELNPDFIDSIVLQQAGSEIINKVT